MVRDCYRLKDLARLWGLHIETLRRWRKEGKLKAFRKPGSLRGNWLVTHEERMRIERMEELPK